MTRIQLEQRVFDLLGERQTAPQIAEQLGIEPRYAAQVIRQVVEHRGTPSLERASIAIDQLDSVRLA